MKTKLKSGAALSALKRKVTKLASSRVNTAAPKVNTKRVAAMSGAKKKSVNKS